MAKKAKLKRMTYFYNKIENVSKAPYLHLRTSELGYKDMHFLEHSPVVRRIIASNRQNLLNS